MLSRKILRSEEHSQKLQLAASQVLQIFFLQGVGVWKMCHGRDGQWIHNGGKRQTKNTDFLRVWITVSNTQLFLS